MAQHLYGLFEHAVGYALFQVKEFDEMALLAPRVEQNVLDLGKFNSLVKTVAVFPFKNSQNALENINSISEGVLTEDLKIFLENNLAKSTKKLRVILGVSETKLGAAISEELGIECTTGGVIHELMRGFRLHFSSLVKEGKITSAVSAKAQLSLGHSYSRAKVKFNIHRVDNMIIQSIALLDQLDKDVNTFSMRIREWYSYHFPELVKIVPDNYMYARCVQLIRDRQQLSPDMADALEEVIMDSAKVQAVFDSAKSSMGMDISPLDLINVQECASRVIGLAQYRQKLAKYLVDKMKAVAPNLGALIGEQVAARLIAHAGSLTNLAKYPASTVQILGAEKALFRALKTRGNTPKYGLIYHSTFIGRAGQKNKGRISRYLANKCSIASRIDCFAEFPTEVFGEHMRQQVEDRLKFYESGEAPPKNVDVMKHAAKAASEQQAQLKKKEKRRKKKEKKQAEDGDATMDTTGDVSMGSEETPRKKRKHEESMEVSVNGDVEEGAAGGKKKKKKKKSKTEDKETEEETSVVATPTPTKNKKKKKHTP